MKKRKLGDVPPNCIPVVDRNGFTRGHMHGAGGGAACAARFTGNPNMALGKRDGRQAWIEQDTPRPAKRRQVETANRKSARGSVRAPR